MWKVLRRVKLPARKTKNADSKAALFKGLCRTIAICAAVAFITMQCVPPTSVPPSERKGPAGWQTFAEFLSANPMWQDNDAYIFHVANNVSLPRRSQPSGLSYMNAPLVLQHYLVSLHQPDVGMIDMPNLIRHHFSAEQFHQHIFADQGGSSRAILQMILEPCSLRVEDFPADEYEEDLKRYGPGLVSHFRVYDDFLNDRKTSFDGAPQPIEGKSLDDSDGFHGFHAMVLIGFRRDAQTGKRWFLLQNWWPHSQFVEVSEGYLKHCRPTVYFVKNPQTKIPSKFPRLSQWVAETEDIDRPEQPLGPYRPERVCIGSKNGGCICH